MTKVWGGRFQKEFSSAAEKLSFSFCFDHRLFSYDIKLNLVYSEALYRKNILSQKEFVAIQKQLNYLSSHFEAALNQSPHNDEDIHSCIERLVTEKIGDIGKKMHTGKSRNDQIATDIRLYLKDELSAIIQLLLSLLKNLWRQSEQNLSIQFPGMTHMQPAQPILLSHHLMAYFEMFERDLKRFQSNLISTDHCPLGSGALAGNNYGVDRTFIAEKLGFTAVTQNSMDAVSDRDFLFDFLSSANICMTHLSRFCEEIVLWSSPIFGFIEIGDDFTTGSSLMPQKKNPDIAELIRGKTGRILGHYVSLTHMMKGLPLAYNRDLQEDKEPVFDTVDTIKESIMCFDQMLGTIVFQTHKINDALTKGFTLATDLADYLVQKNIPFRTAHELTGKMVLYAQTHHKQLEALTLKEFQSFHSAIEKDIITALTYSSAINSKDLLGGTSPNQVTHQLKQKKEAYQW